MVGVVIALTHVSGLARLLTVSHSRLPLRAVLSPPSRSQSPPYLRSSLPPAEADETSIWSLGLWWSLSSP
ncbi:uncharacterized protein DS421_17g593090 [Arachis hypogaea]|nr:uncharacterized protein DS421_17g593090 [Arachis hypogaea]